ncbi:unnamed protein product [Microthlaspi erraticum]|uniref:Uncharacterized protein n=1 Tax=Microthlaspi erraticum TaxID=1685480 RepID=A0A6D2JLS9_9BRAS|nr:unnamed protein product [Microthlaspi erraticum]
MTLFPTKFENGKIEYKIRYKGRSRPFSRAKALVTSEQSRDPTKLKELLSQVLTITLDGVKGASSTDSSIELETRATRSSSTTRPRYFSEEQFKMLRVREAQLHRRREEASKKERLKMQGFGEEKQRMEESDAEGVSLRSESEQGEFEIGVNLVQEEGNGSPSEEGSDETESEEEGEEVNQELRSEQENQENAMEEAEQRKRMSSPCTKSTTMLSSPWTSWRPSTHMLTHEGPWNL